MGYHKTEIIKGEVGKLSKIQEELDELRDAMSQNVKILALVELSDLIGAIESFIEQNFKDISIKDLHEMSKLTKSAFLDGSRISKNAKLLSEEEI